MVGDAEDKAKGEQPHGFYIHPTAIRIGKLKRETQSYLPVKCTCKDVVKAVLQMPKHTISGSFLFNMIKLKGKAENENEKSSHQLGYNLTAL